MSDWSGRVEALRTWATHSPLPWVAEWVAAFMEKYDRNRDLGWAEADAWRQAETQASHYWKGA